MNTRDELFTQVLVRNNRTTTDGFITDANLQAWFRDAVIWASGYRKWPFTEARDASQTWSGSETVEYSSFGPKFKSDTIRIIIIGTNRLTKLNFADYQIFRETEPSGTGRYFSDYNRTVYINPNADVSGTLYAYAQEQTTVDLTNETGTTPFSTYDAEGNEAIYEKMSSYLKRREHLADEAELHDTRASAKLEEVWQRIQQEQALYQTHPDRGGMYKYFNVVDGRGINNPLWDENQL